MTLFSVFDISIEHPKNWKIIFSPKTPPDYDNGFIRIEDFIPRKGAQVSLSINWQKVPENSVNFASSYCENIRNQYGKQLKKSSYELETVEIIDFRGKKAAFLITEYQGNVSLMNKKNVESVRTIQLAFYDETTSRAVVSSIIGIPELVKEKEDFLKSLVLSVNSQKYTLLEDIAV